MYAEFGKESAIVTMNFPSLVCLGHELYRKLLELHIYIKQCCNRSILICTLPCHNIWLKFTLHVYVVPI